MPRMSHGSVLSLNQSPVVGEGREFEAEAAQIAPCPPVPDSGFWPFGFLFRELQLDPANLLPTDEATVHNLQRLGAEMCDPGSVKLRGVPVVLGIMDNQFAELLEGNLSVGDDLVIGTEEAFNGGAR